MQRARNDQSTETTEPTLPVLRAILQSTIGLLTEVPDMANAQANLILRHVRDLVGVTTLDPRSDLQLLQRFTGERAQAAFEALVRRHGSLVYGVCRHGLRRVFVEGMTPEGVTNFREMVAALKK